MSENDVTTSRILVEVETERDRQRAKGWTREHDQEHGPVHLVTEALRRVGGIPIVPADRKRLVQAAALLVAAVEVMDATEATPWPFKPGDVVLDSGEDADHTAWLEAAPERTVISDCDGDEWARKNDGLWWMNRGRTARAKSADLTEQVGPLTVVSVPEATR